MDTKCVSVAPFSHQTQCLSSSFSTRFNVYLVAGGLVVERGESISYHIFVLHDINYSTIHFILGITCMANVPWYESLKSLNWVVGEEG